MINMGELDIRTKYMGLKLNSPIVVSSCTLSEDVDNIRRMEDNGAGAVVLFSLFEEQIRGENVVPSEEEDNILDTSNEVAGYFPSLDEYHVGAESYLELIREAKEKVDLPIIASLNGVTDAGWMNYARLMEEAGADALEVNVFYIPADISLDGRAVEEKYLNIVRRLKQTVDIPIAIKLNPYFSAMGNMASQLVDAGADGLAMFNRFYQPDYDVHQLKVVSNLQYSSPAEIRLPLMWISALYGRLDVSFAATSGVRDSEEVIKYLLAGANVVMTASSLYKYGIGHLKSLNRGLKKWMEFMQLGYLDKFRGIMSQQNIEDPTAYERANYIKVLDNVK